MADNFKTIHEGGRRFKPQSSDPSNPTEGDVFFSDGTPRTKGLWQYKDAAWAQLETKVEACSKHETNAGQSISNLILTIIDFEDQVYDDDSAVTTGASWNYEVQTGKDGKYLVNAAILFTSAAWTQNQGAQLDVYVNGGRVATLDVDFLDATTTQELGLSGSTIVDVSATDTIDIRLTQTRGSATTLNSSAAANYVTVTRICS